MLLALVVLLLLTPMLAVIVLLRKGDLVPTAVADTDLRADDVLEEDAERLVVFEET